MTNLRKAPAVAEAPPIAAGLSGCSNMKLRRLTRLVSRHYDAHMAQCGLKTTQYSLLAIITDRGPLLQGELARQLSLDASTLTRNLRPLLEAGLVVVAAGRDARSRHPLADPRFVIQPFLQHPGSILCHAQPRSPCNGCNCNYCRYNRWR